MKRALSLALAAILAASVLTSCAFTTRTALDPKITVTSSDALDAAAWLSEALGGLERNVVLGTNADGYSVDLSTLEADGYIIRTLGGEDVLLAKTAAGLDRAVRKYAKMTKAGSVADVT